MKNNILLTLLALLTLGCTVKEPEIQGIKAVEEPTVGAIAQIEGKVDGYSNLDEGYRLELRSYEEYYFTGNWFRGKALPQNARLTDNTWGKGYEVINQTLKINLLDGDRTITLPDFEDSLSITEFKQAEHRELYILTFYFEKDNFSESYYIHLNYDEASFWLEQVKKTETPLLANGKDNIYYKISGPEFEGIPIIIEDEQEDTDVLKETIIATFEPLTTDEVLAYKADEENRDRLWIKSLYAQNLYDESKIRPLGEEVLKYFSRGSQFSKDRKNAISEFFDGVWYLDGEAGVIKTLPNKEWNIRGGASFSSDGKYILYIRSRGDNIQVMHKFLFVLYDVHEQRVIKEFEWIREDDYHEIQYPIYKNGKFIVFITEEKGYVVAAAEINPEILEFSELFDTRYAKEYVDYGHYIDEVWQSDTDKTYYEAEITFE